MNTQLSLVGSILGGIGMLVALVAAVARLAGFFHLGGFEAMTLFNGATGLMVAGCFLKLLVIARR